MNEVESSRVQSSLPCCELCSVHGLALHYRQDLPPLEDTAGAGSSDALDSKEKLGLVWSARY